MNHPLFPCGYCHETNVASHCYFTEDQYGTTYRVVFHESCGAFSLFPRPDEQALQKAYDDSYYGSSEKKFTFPLVERVIEWFREGRARKLAKWLNEGDRVLDLGCGNGHFLKALLKRKPIRAHGIELAGKAAARAAQIPGIILKTTKLQINDFPEKSIKAVCMFHVYEHLPEPLETLEIIDHILQEEGILMISFPNADSIQSRLFKGRWLHLDPPRHLSLVKPSAFKKMMREKGYRLLNESYASMEQNPYGMIQSILNLICPKRDLLFESLKGNKAYRESYPAWKLTLQRLFFIVSFPLFGLTNLTAAILKRGATVEFIFIRTTKAARICL
ncbi:MAG TPA: class I SAM-dependent methyltransferase [Bacteroidales bacterium]|nr:class I SAM-dependent methyltransferase [Bacteroidales bacterium]HSA44070.1 class I SAM-dependent methyltransferase [Bacteroidales bacterium]